MIIVKFDFYLISLNNIFKEDFTMTKGQLIAIASTAAVVATAATITVIVINKKKAELLYGEIGTSELNDTEVDEMTQYFSNDIKNIDAELYKIKQHILYMRQKIEQKK